MEIEYAILEQEIITSGKYDDEKPYREFLYHNSHKAEREYYDMSK